MCGGSINHKQGYARHFRHFLQNIRRKGRTTSFPISRSVSTHPLDQQLLKPAMGMEKVNREPVTCLLSLHVVCLKNSKTPSYALPFPQSFSSHVLLRRAVNGEHGCCRSAAAIKMSNFLEPRRSAAAAGQSAAAA